MLPLDLLEARIDSSYQLCTVALVLKRLIVPTDSVIQVLCGLRLETSPDIYIYIYIFYQPSTLPLRLFLTSLRRFLCSLLRALAALETPVRCLRILGRG
jgi:hypothetical protein